MRRIILSLVLVILSGTLAFTASADDVTLSENLANALLSADVKTSEGSSVTVTLVSDDTVSLSVDSDDVALIDFSEANLSGLTANDFASFDVSFTGLETLNIALPVSYEGEFALSLDKLKLLDVSGSTADFTLSVYDMPNIESLKADNCPNLKAVNLALVEPKSSSGGGLGGLFGGGGNSESKLITSPLNKLSSIELTNNPTLDRVGYLLSRDSGGGIGGMFGGSSTPTFIGYKAHCFITTLRRTTYYPEETSHPEGTASTNPLETFTGGGGSNLGSYTEKTVNLIPALTTLILTNSGTDEIDSIKFIDISDASALASAKLDGMTQLQEITFPVGTTLKTLDLTGDTALTSLDLSNTLGFLWPEGFNTLTGLQKLRAADREDLAFVDLSGLSGLKELDLTNDDFVSIDISANKLLERLFVANNKITSLDLDGHTKFTKIDVRNNALTKIDLSRNANIHVNKNSPEDSAVSLSVQRRLMTDKRSRKFDFSRVGLEADEFVNVVAESVMGDGVAAVSFDHKTGTAVFESSPSLITYNYKSGVFYEATTEPVCMNVKLAWNVSEDVSEDVTPNSEGAVSGSSGGGCESFGLCAVGLAFVFIVMKKR